MVVFFLLAGFAGGACHCETPVTVFFPYWMIALGAFNWESISNILLIIQFPVYALAMARARGDNWKALTFLILLTLHVAAVITAFRVYRHS